MEIPFRRRSVAEERHGHLLLFAIPDGVGEAGGVERLAADGNGYGQIVQALGDRSALIVAAIQKQDAFETLSATDFGRHFPKRRYQPVIRFENGDGADLSLLALDRGKGPDAALALKSEHALIESSSQHHRSMDLEQDLVGYGRLQTAVNLPLLIQDRQIFHAVRKINLSSRH